MEQIKNTAVQWVIQYLNNVKPNEFCSIEKIKEVLEQAKEMEKEQHKQTWFESTSQFANESEMLYKKDFEQYYNETYGK